MLIIGKVHATLIHKDVDRTIGAPLLLLCLLRQKANIEACILEPSLRFPIHVWETTLLATNILMKLMRHYVHFVSTRTDLMRSNHMKR